jgi:hypothetical protein
MYVALSIHTDEACAMRLSFQEPCIAQPGESGWRRFTAMILGRSAMDTTRRGYCRCV